MSEDVHDRPQPGAEGSGLGGPRSSGPAAGSGDGRIEDVHPDDQRLLERSDDGPAGAMDSSVGDLGDLDDPEDVDEP